MWSDSRLRLYRDPARGWLAGVCAGIADYFGIEPAVVRLAYVLALCVFFFPAALAYAVAAIAVKPRPPALYASPDEQQFWRGVATAPQSALHELKRRFGALDARLQEMERQVTSGEFELHRGFKDLR